MKENRPLRPMPVTPVKYTFVEEDHAAHEKAQESYRRIEKAGVKEGQRVTIGSKFAHENDYEIFIGAEGYVYSIMQYDAQAIVAFPNAKLRVIEIEDCIPIEEA